MKKIMIVAGARPNFMKIAPVIRAIKKHTTLQHILVHTGQHYDNNMSGTFFKTLGIPEPDYNLQVGSSTHAVQTADIMVKFEEVCMKEKPDVVVVVGDVNSTIAAGLTAKKLNITLAHIEAGLRSGDRLMPEEINRLATDAITDLFFTTEKEATSNLLKEGHPPSDIHFVGHVMIDNLFYQLENLNEDTVMKDVVSLKKSLPEKYICMTLHRPSNVDNKGNLEKIITAIRTISDAVPVIFPIHPRTKKNIEQFGLTPLLDTKSIIITDPLDYNDFLYLWKGCSAVLTDSGGLQEETSALKVPCITMRDSTERPITVEVGSNVIVGTDEKKIVDYTFSALEGKWKQCGIPEFWDGNASVRIAGVLTNCTNN